MAVGQPYITQFRLNNKLIPDPVEGNQIKVNVNFDTTVQADIDTSTFTFVNESYKQIKDYISEGLNGGVGITEGMSLIANIQDGQTSTEVLNAFLDFSTFTDDEANARCEVSILKADGLNSIRDRLEGLTFRLLEANGTITQNDWQKVDYVVEKKITFLEQAFLALSIYLMIKELAEASYRLSQTIATISSILASGITGQVGAFIYSVASAIFEAAYIAILGASLVELIINFKENLIPRVRQYYGINFRVALNGIFSHLGYDFVSPIKELDEYLYLPSKADGREDKGIPFESDYGFTALQFISLCRRMFNAKLVVFDGKVHLRTESDPLFFQNSTFVMRSILNKKPTPNLNELKETRFYSFESDVADEYTSSNWKGTSLVVTTTQKTTNNEKHVLIKGNEEIRFPVALGSAKTELSALEKALNAFFETANFVLNLFGESVTEPIEKRIDVLKVSQEFFSVPKVMKVNGRKLAKDNRTSLSARYLWDKYHNYNSFVQSNYQRQRYLYSGVEIPFSFKDYAELTENSYFTTDDGRRGKFTNIEWDVGADTAEAEYWIEEVWSKNLKEELFEAA